MSVSTSEQKAAFLLHQLSMQLCFARRFCRGGLQAFGGWKTQELLRAYSQLFFWGGYIGGTQGNLCRDRDQTWWVTCKQSLISYTITIILPRKLSFLQVWGYIPAVVVSKTYSSIQRVSIIHSYMYVPKESDLQLSYQEGPRQILLNKGGRYFGKDCLQNPLLCCQERSEQKKIVRKYKKNAYIKFQNINFQ